MKEQISKILWEEFNKCLKQDPKFSWDTLFDVISTRLAGEFEEKMPAIELQKKLDAIKLVLES